MKREIKATYDDFSEEALAALIERMPAYFVGFEGDDIEIKIVIKAVK